MTPVHHIAPQEMIHDLNRWQGRVGRLGRLLGRVDVHGVARRRGARRGARTTSLVIAALEAVDDVFPESLDHTNVLEPRLVVPLVTRLAAVVGLGGRGADGRHGRLGGLWRGRAVTLDNGADGTRASTLQHAARVTTTRVVVKRWSQSRGCGLAWVARGHGRESGVQVGRRRAMTACGGEPRGGSAWRVTRSVRQST